MQSPANGDVRAVTWVLLVEAKAAQHAAHADHKEEGKACQEPNTALGAFRNRTVGKEGRMTFRIGEAAPSESSAAGYATVHKATVNHIKEPHGAHMKVLDARLQVTPRVGAGGMGQGMRGLRSPSAPRAVARCGAVARK